MSFGLWPSILTVIGSRFRLKKMMTAIISACCSCLTGYLALRGCFFAKETYSETIQQCVRYQRPR